MGVMFEKIKKYYDFGLWNEERLRNVVNVGAITAEEFEMITGKSFWE